ncbi:MAG: glutamate--tRNA ligase [Ignavibacteriae bacterium]|nr:glutamate--tRNA ligase [Ignavibacteriota bacterium]MCB9243112.1 glutamate--tRNA ligase [Ignavibacteriales bacterium]
MGEKSNIRVRFAPSPTGYLHLGSLRTALFNFLYARHTGGKFILRVEDTDQTRYVEGAVENLIKTMNSLGLDYDEGPVKGGDFGPYYQSERLDIYKKYAFELVEKGYAYYAFETSEELEEMRKMAKLEGRMTSYDRRGRNLTEDEVKANLEKELPYVIRLKVPLNEEVKFDDIVKGTIKIETNMVDDQVLLKSDGFPTYHLANVVDDHLMGITHIIRGEEWITSVPKHIILYKAFGWDVPEMVHCPLILNPDKTKLSKRQGDVAVEDYLQKGYLPEALVNFMALLGWHPGEGESDELFTMDQLVEKFTLERIQTSGAVFSVEKLNWMNNHYIKEYDLDKLTDLAMPFFKHEHVDTNDRERIKEVLDTIRVYLNKLDEIPEHIGMFYNDEIKVGGHQEDILKEDTSKTVFQELAKKVEAMDTIEPDAFKEKMKEVQAETGIKGKQLFKPIRIALTGSEDGPELPKIAQILGKEKVVRFLKRWVKLTESEDVIEPEGKSEESKEIQEKPSSSFGYITALAQINVKIESNPEDSLLYLQRATIYFTQKKYEEANQDVKRSIELKPDLYEGYFIRGTINLLKNNLNIAKKDFKKAYELSKDEVIKSFIEENFPKILQNEKDFELDWESRKIEIDLNYFLTFLNTHWEK